MFIKTHYPYIYPFCKPIAGSKSLVLVRNPFDSMVSIWQLSVNMTHTRSMLNDFPNEFPEEWDWFVKEHIKVFNGFYDFWMEQSKSGNHPVHFIRFEDILTHQKDVTLGAFEFSLGKESLKGKYLEKRIDNLLEDTSKTGIYKPRSGKFNASAKYFNAEHQELVKQGVKKWALFFGYGQLPGEEEDEYTVFKYDEATEEERALSRQMKNYNKKMMDEITQNKEQVNLELHQKDQTNGLNIPITEIAAVKLKHLKPQIRME